MVFIYVKFWYFFGKICAITKTNITVNFNKAVEEGDELANIILVAPSGAEITASGAPAVGATSASYAFSTPLTEEGTYTIKGTSVTAEYQVAEVAFSITTDKTEYNANGEEVMIVTATLYGEDGNPITDFAGTAVFQSEKGLVSAQAQQSFDDGKVIFNVTVPKLVLDTQDTLTVKINYAENDEYNNLVSLPLSVKYNRYDPSTGGPGNTIAYPIDAVTAGTYNDKVVADRVTVYVSGVLPEHLDDITAGIKSQLKIADDIGFGTSLVVDEVIPVLLGTESEGSYAFHVLLDVPDWNDTAYGSDVLISDNQYNYYKIDSSAESIKLATVTAAADKKFMVIDKTMPSIIDMKVPNAENPNYLPQLTLMAKFSEPIDVITAQNPSNWRINGRTLTASDVEIRVLDSSEEMNRTGAPNWNTGGWSTVMNGKAITDFEAFTEEEDGNRERNLVVMKLTPSFAANYMESGQNTIQANSIVDWAGNTDLSDNNKVNTQNFYFDYSVPESTPGISIEMDSSSPEQFVLTLNEALFTDANATNAVDLTTYADLFVGLVEVDEDKYPADERVKSTNITDTIITLEGTDYAISQHPAGDNTSYLLELTKDWTKFLDADANGDGDLLTANKFFANKRLVVAINGTVYDVLGNKLAINTSSDPVVAATPSAVPTAAAPNELAIYDSVTIDDVQLVEDTTSPYVVDNSWYHVTKDADGNDVVDGKIGFTMSEPVQMFKADGTPVIVPGVTASIQQDTEGVPVPTFEYRKGDLRIDGVIISAADFDKADKTFEVAPDVNGNGVYDAGTDILESGDWKLIVRSVSDDYGNTSVTSSVDFTIQGAVTPDADVDPVVTWAFADDDADIDGDGNVDGDYVYVLYSTKMNPQVLDAATYDINGKQVNQDAEITSEYLGNTANPVYGSAESVKDIQAQLVTIKLPSDFIEGGDDLTGGSNHQSLTLPGSLTARTGESLQGPLQLQLKYEEGHGAGATVDTDGFNLPAMDNTNWGDYTTADAYYAYLQSIGVSFAATAETTKGVAEVQQVETATTIAADVIDGNGNYDVTVTAADGGNLAAGKTINVAVVATDDADAVAGKVRTALGADGDVTTWFAVSGAGSDIVLTANTAAADDTTINISLADGTSTATTSNGGAGSALTAVPNSVDTTAGAAEAKEVATTTVTAGATRGGTITVNVADGTINQDVTVTVTAGMTADEVANAARLALAADGTVNGAYTVTGAGAEIILTQTAAGADVDLQVTLN
ncbi:hypothetical protein R9X47_18700 [Wukongibacter baidiensis]|uniref:hypothetical protein n=1 Tax=Wukongibacter baidiensis TaxID=1723361 RepID=UPI003D7F6FFB